MNRIIIHLDVVYQNTDPLTLWVECLPMVWEIGIQSTVESKMVLDTSLLNTQHYKVRIMGKVEQSRERSSNLPYTSV